MRLVALLDVCLHGCGGEMESKGASDDKHGWGVDASEGQVSYKLSLNNGADVR